MGEEGGGGGIYRSYCFWLVSSILDPQDSTMAYYSSNEKFDETCVNLNYLFDNDIFIGKKKKKINTSLKIDTPFHCMNSFSQRDIITP